MKRLKRWSSIKNCRKNSTYKNSTYFSLGAVSNLRARTIFFKQKKSEKRKTKRIRIHIQTDLCKCIPQTDGPPPEEKGQTFGVPKGFVFMSLFFLDGRELDFCLIRRVFLVGHMTSHRKKYI